MLCVSELTVQKEASCPILGDVKWRAGGVVGWFVSFSTPGSS
jgi:hypothetical protein